MRQTTNTPKQLVPAYLDSKPASWRQDYVRNLRPVRGYPNWWRIVDNVAHIDGPPTEGAQYTRDLYVWKASVLQDAADNNTDTLELYNLVELLDSGERTLPNGDTEYRYKYSDVPPALTYQHTDVIDSVSVEFDQLGRRMVAFESMGDVFLIWYDTQASDTVVTNFGAGYNPQIVTDTYLRLGGPAASARILFYVDNTTKQVVYRLQDDRFGVVYTLPNAPSDVVEILKVSKNLYGGLTVLYVYEDSPGNLTTGSFTARDAVDVVNIGTDGNQKSRGELSATSGYVSSFLLVVRLKEAVVTNTAALAPATGTISDFKLGNNRLEGGVSRATLSSSTGTVSDFSLKGQRTLYETGDAAELESLTGEVTDFFLKETLIELSSYGVEEAELTAVTGQVTDFLLG